MNLTELRKLASKLNKEDQIKGVWKMKRPEIEKELEKVRYRIDDEAKKLLPAVEMKRKRIISLDKPKPKEAKVSKAKGKVMLKPPKDLVKSIKPEKRFRTKEERDRRVAEIKANIERRKAQKK